MYGERATLDIFEQEVRTASEVEERTTLMLTTLGSRHKASPARTIMWGRPGRSALPAGSYGVFFSSFPWEPFG